MHYSQYCLVSLKISLRYFVLQAALIATIAYINIRLWETFLQLCATSAINFDVHLQVFTL